MDKKYLFFIDIDGTLVPSGQNEILPEIVDEIARLKKLGHIFAISTGRAFNTTLKIKGIEVFQYISVLLGSCIYKMPEKELLHKSNNIPSEEVKKFIDFLNKENIEWSYKDDVDEKTIFCESKYAKNKKNIKFTKIEEFNNDLLNDNVMQLLTLTHFSEEQMKRFSAFDFFSMPNSYTDVTLKGSSKSRCVDVLKQYYPNMKTVSIGDAHNDFPMFEKTDISIAMGNAQEEVKEKVDYVTKDINDNGLIYVFRNILKL